MLLHICLEHFYLILLYFITLLILVLSVMYKILSLLITKKIFIFFLNFIYSAEVAKHLNEDSTGLIFGVNNFMAVVFQTVLTIVVVDERGLALTTRTQVCSVLYKHLVS